MCAAEMFLSQGTCAYQMKQQARCLIALEGDTDRNRFVLGSLELKGDNELHVLDFNNFKTKRHNFPRGLRMTTKVKVKVKPMTPKLSKELRQPHARSSFVGPTPHLCN